MTPEELLKLRNRIHEDFVSHVDLSRPGIYTIKDSDKVYVITEDSSRNYQFALNKADNAIFIFKYRISYPFLSRLLYLAVIRITLHIESRMTDFQKIFHTKSLTH